MNTSSTRYTPELFAKRMAELHEQLDSNRSAIASHWQTLFAPADTSGSKVQQFVHQAERAVAIYDGVMLGYKLLHRWRSTMSKWGKKLHRKKK